MPITHRGWHNSEKGIPENSLEAFQESVEAGLPIELDVQFTSDRVLMVYHDEDLVRMTGTNKLFSSVSYKEVQNLRLIPSNQRIPSLPEVLTIVEGKVPLLIEIKPYLRVGQLESVLLELMSGYSGNYAVQSFNPFSLQWFKKNAPMVPRGQLSSDFKNEMITYPRKFLLRHLLLNRFSEPAFVSYDIRGLPFWRVEHVRRNRTPIIGWTVRTPKEWETARKWCDNVIFEGDLIS
ncbi:MAG: glycerophosphodiester phosphodiesterase family protein [Desulfomonilaceae bacterium]